MNNAWAKMSYNQEIFMNKLPIKKVNQRNNTSCITMQFFVVLYVICKMQRRYNENERG